MSDDPHATGTRVLTIPEQRIARGGYVADLQRAHDALLDLYATHEYTNPFRWTLQGIIVNMMNVLTAEMEAQDRG